MQWCGQLTSITASFNFSRMPLPAIWGPKLWDILHGIGARAGKSMLQTRRDEERELKWIFEHLEQIVPCQECRKHIIEYRKENPLPEKGLGYAHWIWQFHEAVNARLGKPSVVLVDGFGSSVILTKAWTEFKNCMRDSLMKGSVKGEFVANWRLHMKLWQGFCGC